MRDNPAEAATLRCRFCETAFHYRLTLSITEHYSHYITTSLGRSKTFGAWLACIWMSNICQIRRFTEAFVWHKEAVHAIAPSVQDLERLERDAGLEGTFNLCRVRRGRAQTQARPFEVPGLGKGPGKSHRVRFVVPIAELMVFR
jgi:hypothetical protein